jgi:hypothetical protein
MPPISGHFTIMDGKIVAGSGPEPEISEPDPPQDGFTPNHIFNENLYVDGNQCLGTQCIGTEIFGYDTLRLKQDNLRIMFHDTSGALPGFPSNSRRWSKSDRKKGEEGSENESERKSP